MQWTWTSYDLQFKRPAGTSRGVLRTKRSYFLKAEHEGKFYYGECGILEGLSPDGSGYEARLDRVCAEMGAGNSDDNTGALMEYPSIRFGVEMLESAITRDGENYMDSAWSRGEEVIEINGLIWMGDYAYMRDQIEQKLSQNWKCLKLKIGAIDHAEELTLLKRIRAEYSRDDVEIRVDANGAFEPDQAYDILQRLHELDIHSIEQPIRAGQWDAMSELVERSGLAIALDEELIDVYGDKRRLLLETIQPDFIILKPSLLGGWQASDEWISLASGLNIDWWATSALESNIGLNAIAQWVAQYPLTRPQGLGTGLLYEQNIPSPLELRDGYLSYDKSKGWNYSLLT